MVFSGVLLARRAITRPLIFQSLRWGASLTLLTVLVLVVMVFVNWDYFFDQFHATFFAEGTWQFYANDTLIRLYPEQFWFDMSLFIGAMTILGAAICIASPWLWREFGDSSIEMTASTTQSDEALSV
jgi:integral membrane protein (TIGR01906 family)